MKNVTAEQLRIIFEAARGRLDKNDLYHVDIDEEDLESFLILINSLSIMSNAEYIMDYPYNNLPI